MHLNVCKSSFDRLVMARGRPVSRAASASTGGRPFRFRGVVQQSAGSPTTPMRPGYRRAEEARTASLRRCRRSNPTNRNEKNSPRLWLAPRRNRSRSPALAQRIPARERDDRRGGAHRLRPAVQAPHHGERDEQHHVAVGMTESHASPSTPDQHVGRPQRRIRPVAMKRLMLQ